MCSALPLALRQKDESENWQEGFLVTDALLRSYTRAHGNLGMLDSIRKAGGTGSAWYVTVSSPVCQ